MKKFYLLLTLVLCTSLMSACSTSQDLAEPPTRAPSPTTIAPSETMNQVTETTNETTTTVESKTTTPEPPNMDQYLGDRLIKMPSDETLYLLTGLEDVHGSTGLYIDDISDNHLKGSLYAIGPESTGFRQAIVDFEGDIIDGQLTTTYEDEAWAYSGKIDLTFEPNEIKAHISRDPSDSSVLWGIPEGSFNYLPPIATEEIALTEDLNETLSAIIQLHINAGLDPFEEGGLTDDDLITFVCSNAMEGAFKEIAYDSEEGALIFDGATMDVITTKYFGKQVKNHHSTTGFVYENGLYKVPAADGVAEWPVIARLLIDTNNEKTYYALVHYLFYEEGPASENLVLEYQQLIQFESNDANHYITKEIIRLENPWPIDESLLVNPWAELP